jgi:2-keto-4-pentenoate hydratase/2-oxohepta-3-ene-1,7-dioic acid hydratase in catechol pathway
VISRHCRTVSIGEAVDYILGYTCANDVTAWDVLQREVQFTRCKSYDTFGPFGPFIVTGEEFNPDDLGIRSYVNGSVALENTTRDMVYSCRELVSFASHCMTLLPGDVISTGASGMSHLQDGDRVEIEVDHVGRLANVLTRGG